MVPVLGVCRTNSWFVVRRCRFVVVVFFFLPDEDKRGDSSKSTISGSSPASLSDA